jgi:tetratricopeptide (TPR) repeat protein
LPPTDEAAVSQPTSRDPFDVPTIEAPTIEAPAQAIELTPPTSITDDPLGAQAIPTTPGNVNPLPLVISDYSDSPEGWFAEAQQLAQTAESIEDLTKIIELCQQSLAQGPPTELAGPLRRLAGWAHNRCGELQIEQGLEAEAVRNFQVAISLDPNCSLAIHNRAVTLAQQNQPEAALRDFNRVIELNPGLSVAYRNRAELLASLGRFNEALTDYTRAIDGLPEAADLYRARGITLQRLGMFDRAAADLDHAIQLSPNDADSYTQRGNLAAERGDFERAASDLRRAIEINPRWADAYRSLAWLHATCPNADFRDPQQAITAAEEAAKLSPPTDCFALDALAVAQASAGNFEDAARLTEQAIASAPPDYAELLRQRLNLYQQGQPFINQPADSVRAASHATPIDK